MKNPLTQSLISTASLLAFASVVAAQNAQPTEQSGSSLSDVLRNARYEFGRGLTFTSADGDSSATVGGQIQASYNWTEANFGFDANGAPVLAPNDFSANSAFDVGARLRVGGSVWDGQVEYLLQMSPNGGEQGAGNDGNLVDAWVNWGLADGISIRLGTQKMRSGLSADTSANDTDFETIGRSFATDEFANSRATGALIQGAAMSDRFNWHVGVANNGTARNATSSLLGLNAGANQGNDDTDMMVTAGASFGSHAGNSESWSEGDLARAGEMQWIVGATFTADNGDVAGVNDDSETINAFFGMKMGNGLAAQLEYWTRDNEQAIDTTDDGAYAQLSYTMAKSGSMQPGVVVRYSTATWEQGPGLNDVELDGYLVGVNAYFAGHDLKTQLSYSTGSASGLFATDAEQTSVDLMMTVVF